MPSGLAPTSPASSVSPQTSPVRIGWPQPHQRRHAVVVSPQLSPVRIHHRYHLKRLLCAPTGRIHFLAPTLFGPARAHLNEHRHCAIASACRSPTRICATHVSLAAAHTLGGPDTFLVGARPSSEWPVRRGAGADCVRGAFACDGFLPSRSPEPCFKPPSIRHEWPVASNVETTTTPVKLPSRSASVTQPPSSSSSALEVQHAPAPSATEDRPQSESESASASAPLITPTLTPLPALSCTDNIPELPSPSQSIPDSQPLASFSFSASKPQHAPVPSATGDQHESEPASTSLAETLAPKLLLSPSIPSHPSDTLCRLPEDRVPPLSELPGFSSSHASPPVSSLVGDSEPESTTPTPAINVVSVSISLLPPSLLDNPTPLLLTPPLGVLLSAPVLPLSQPARSPFEVTTVVNSPWLLYLVPRLSLDYGDSSALAPRFLYFTYVFFLSSLILCFHSRRLPTFQVQPSIYLPSYQSQ
jgi:hypothetical protein